jgi:LuxR family maltose regulon positive regulatory protein
MQLTQARERLAKDDLAAAQSLLENIIPAARAGERVGHLIEALVLYNLCLQRQKRGNAAVTVLEEAIRLGEAEGYKQVFIDGGEVIIDQIEQHLFSQPHAKIIIATWKQSHKLSGKQNLIELLTEREMDVLHLLSAGLTNQQIAVRLHIALDTVKHHTSKIYGKLSVNNRTQAVAKSRTIGLLE